MKHPTPAGPPRFNYIKRRPLGGGAGGLGSLSPQGWGSLPANIGEQNATLPLTHLVGLKKRSVATEVLTSQIPIMNLPILFKAELSRMVPENKSIILDEAFDFCFLPLILARSVMEIEV